MGTRDKILQGISSKGNELKRKRENLNFILKLINSCLS